MKVTSSNCNTYVRFKDINIGAVFTWGKSVVHFVKCGEAMAVPLGAPWDGPCYPESDKVVKPANNIHIEY